MRYFVQSWFSTPSNPIGVDFGSDCLRAAQVENVDGEFRLAAAASADVPPHVRNEPLARFTFFGDTIRDLVAEGNFRGRRVMLNLPASLMHIQHLRLPKMDEEALRKALAWECRGKFPFDPSQAVLRHIIAGEIYHDQEPKYEVVVMAARKDLVEQLLAAAAKARLDVAGINVEPKALIDCFSRIYRRKVDLETATLFADIGCTATRAMIAYGGRIQFARVIPIGGEHFSRAVASAMQIPLEQARVLRVSLVSQEPETPPTEIPASPASVPSEENSFALLNVAAAAEATTALAPAPAVNRIAQTADPSQPLPQNAAERQRVEHACQEPLSRMIEELSLCRRYHEATFPNQPVQRLVFVGGEANQRDMCQQIARGLGIAAQIGDPLARINKISEITPETGIDRRRPQPAWAVAIGLSMGPSTEAAGN
jgi:type IV pilus assembly protein PilM